MREEPVSASQPPPWFRMDQNACYRCLAMIESYASSKSSLGYKSSLRDEQSVYLDSSQLPWTIMDRGSSYLAREQMHFRSIIVLFSTAALNQNRPIVNIDILFILFSAVITGRPAIRCWKFALAATSCEHCYWSIHRVFAECLKISPVIYVLYGYAYDWISDIVNTYAYKVKQGMSLANSVKCDAVHDESS
jgi:hypothetical protein